MPSRRAASPAPTSATPTKRAKLDPNIARKLKQLDASLESPFPSYARPTPAECQLVHDRLVACHGAPSRPSRDERPEVLHSLIGTILSQNTTSANSTAAHAAMQERWSSHRDVLASTVEELADTIRSGGLADKKAVVIRRILAVAEARGSKDEDLSLDHMHELSDYDAMRELLSFEGVGPKTAACVLLFCLGRDSFAVDTHVWRISRCLGWVPPYADRETTFQHLNLRIPGALKYNLHLLLVGHGRRCVDCSANGVTSEERIATCPISDLVSSIKATSKAKPKTPKGKAKGKGVKAKPESDDEDTVKDEDEDEAALDAKLVPSPSPSKVELTVKIEAKEE